MVLLDFDIRIENLHPSKGTHWVAYINETSLNNYGCVPLEKTFQVVVKRNGHCLYSENRIQGLKSKRDSFCAVFCLYINYINL